MFIVQRTYRKKSTVFVKEFKNKTIIQLLTAAGPLPLCLPLKREEMPL